ncbi:helix-turn-helix domain-containing protein [Paenibacillus sp. Y412MC10]|uniref:helix-turn-helix domain-containing protein n=1 Tax=Geobacillus sp. (strain Y412MC10) TaxID=481743 RepID=UPI0011AB475B|nr:helix-turn-helix domain-containing protein [Paenibacillus sp. Y412MC10]
MEDLELFDLVSRAQNGDNDAVYQLINILQPAIKSSRYKIKQHDRQDDLEQSIVEILIKKIMSYDLNQAPDFSTFCRQLEQKNDKS